MIDVDGLTIIRGESGVGKSAIVRCVRALLCNRWGRGMIRNESPYCDVAVDFGDGNKLIARKSDSSVIYRMCYADGTTKDYTAMRREVPEEMGTVFGLTMLDDGTSKELLQIRGQYDRPLLVDVTHKRLSGMLGDGSEWMRCVNVDKLVHSWLGMQRGKEKGFLEVEETSELKIQQMEKSLIGLRKQRDVVTKLFDDVSVLYNRISLLNELKNASEKSRRCLKMRNALSSIGAIVSSAEMQIQRATLLKSLKVSVQHVVGIDETRDLLQSVNVLETLIDRRNSLQKLQTLTQEMQRNKFGIDDLHTRLQSNVCPICGQKLN